MDPDGCDARLRSAYCLLKSSCVGFNSAQHGDMSLRLLFSEGPLPFIFVAGGGRCLLVLTQGSAFASWRGEEPAGVSKAGSWFCSYPQSLCPAKGAKLLLTSSKGEQAA